uniref:RNA polymerase Rpb5 N-terminal domain-containing protein n=1 Tax=Kalanchoe fedtschenkoi TaxID=63787 RepID=A0A7N0U8G2_KALFE
MMSSDDELHRLWRIRRTVTVMQMLRDRGYFVSDNDVDISKQHWPHRLLIVITLSSSTSKAEVNVTALISSHPDLSDFANLLTASAVSADLAERSPLTILAVPNTHLRSSDLARHPTSIAHVILYHVLLEYISWPDLRLIPASDRLVATLYQTTGRAFGDLGSVNVTRSPKRVEFRSSRPRPT